jgi:hypothetical protein
MNTTSTIKQFAASSAIAGVLGLAALGLGSGLAAAAPSTHAVTGPTSSSRTSTKVEPEHHELFPGKPHSPHEGQGHKGRNEPLVPVGIEDPSTSHPTNPSNTSDDSQPEEHEVFPVQHGDV